MSDIGIFKEFDKLGRIIIPKEMRERYDMGSKVELVMTERGILIKNRDYLINKREECSSVEEINT